MTRSFHRLLRLLGLVLSRCVPPITRYCWSLATDFQVAGDALNDLNNRLMTVIGSGHASARLYHMEDYRHP